MSLSDDPRLYRVKELLRVYVASSPLPHIRDAYAIHRLAHDILDALDRETQTWRKWNGPREALLKSSAECWIPVEDMRAFLNEMPGPQLTATDVAQRLRAFYEADISYPDEDLRAGCLDIYAREKVAGTELPAIIGAIKEHVEAETQRLWQEREDQRRRATAEAKRLAQQRFLSGADCSWTSMDRSRAVYCRKNGRTYKLAPTLDKRWNLYRVESHESAAGALVGTYSKRADATKALANVAYQPEPRR